MEGITMGEVVGAAILAHVPTIMLPKETRYELNDGKEISLVPGLRNFVNT
jgi:3,4-dihydroxyphenylacetate 2,3-dioxygenase